MPPIDPPSAHELTAAAATAAMRAGRLRAAELVDACLGRIAEREPSVGAWQCVGAEAARSEAGRRDAEPWRGALHGVPIGVKDIIDTADFPTERGSAIDAGRRPAHDAECVARLRGAGAIVIGKTVTTELAYFHPGKTANPHRLGHTPGGSSSGSAAAVADAMVPVALGTQTAGSINRPASFCGIVGYKPSHGDFSLDGVLPFAPSLDTLGVLARSVEDAALVRSVLLPLGAMPPAPSGAPRLALCRTPWWSDASEAVQAGIEKVCARVIAMGMAVGEATLPDGFAALAELQKSVMAFEAATSLRIEYGEHRDRLSAPLQALLAAGAQIPEARYRQELDAARARGDDLARLLQSFDVLITPAVHGEAPAGLEATGDPLFSRAWTLLGVPTLTLPAFRGPTGLPIGIQLVAGRGNDAVLLRAGAAIEAALACGGDGQPIESSLWRAP
ncbi:MAG TPA: amidase [Caldimonas sp.]|jgi:amidase|nr:amidase [Caldimonas sp.]HEX2539997.1 amidase [Caldimonas sp.]